MANTNTSAACFGGSIPQNTPAFGRENIATFSQPVFGFAQPKEISISHDDSVKITQISIRKSENIHIITIKYE